jgi:hypothetical protein
LTSSKQLTLQSPAEKEYFQNTSSGTCTLVTTLLGPTNPLKTEYVFWEKKWKDFKNGPGIMCSHGASMTKFMLISQIC